MAPRPDWNLRMVRSREARRLLPGQGSDVAWGDIRVGHLDTGYTEHPVFGDWTGGSVWLRVADGLNLREAGAGPRDPLDYEGNSGHGTRTCSILCGNATPLADEAGVPSEVGVAPQLPAVPCRIVDSVVLNSESRREAVARGIRHVVDKGCQLVSISLGIPGFPPWATGGMGRAVDDAYEAGTIIVAAAGQIIDRVCYPAKFDRTIGVGGVTSRRRIWFKYESGEDMVDVWGARRRRSARRQPGGRGRCRLSADRGRRSRGLGPERQGCELRQLGCPLGQVWRRCRNLVCHGPRRGRGGHVVLARKDAISAGYAEPWQRVEAFRRLLRATAAPIERDRPANGTGILDIEALLRADLPAAGLLRKASEDEDKWL